MEFYGGERVVVNPLRIKPHVQSELEASLLLYYTGRSRSSEYIIKRQAKNVEQGEEEALKAMVRVKEEAVRMKEALLRGDFEKMGSILNSGWIAKKKTAKEVTNPEIERIFRLARENGAIAGKVSGAGGGGFIMFLVDPVQKARLSDVLKKEAGIVYNCALTQNGAEAWHVAKTSYARKSRSSGI